jgi:ankyrin repeat protein
MPLDPKTEEPFAAILDGDLPRLMRLLGADPALAQRRDKQGFSPLMLALERRRQDMADALTQASLNLDLFEAATLGQAWRLEQLLKADPMLAMAANADGRSALHLAALFGHADAAALLLKRGAPKRIRDKDGLTPLDLALRGGHAAVVELLKD